MAPFRPADGHRVVWREGFGTRFTVFVDTEEEFDWRAPFRHDGWGVSAVAALPDAHRRFAERGVESCYLVDYPVAIDPAAIDALRSIVAHGHGTIGAQLHPWVNPPFDETLSAHSSFAGNLPRALEAAKLDRLTDALTSLAGTAPTVYRAGRYGLGPATLGLLAAHGYALDSSMRARYDYGAQGGPDYRGIGNDAFHTGPDERIVELPLTTVFTGRLRRGGPRLYEGAGRIPRGRGLLARLGLLHRVALTPEDMPLADALAAIRVAVGEGVRVLNFAYHSPSLAPGHTPYVRDAADLAAFWRWWDAVLDLLAALNVQPASSNDILAAVT